MERKKPVYKKQAHYKKWDKEEPEIITPVIEEPVLFPKEDYQFVVGMRKKITPTQFEMDEILRLYRTYVQYVWGYSVGCNCSSSIANLWNTLNGWVLENDAKFAR